LSHFPLWVDEGLKESLWGYFENCTMKDEAGRFDSRNKKGKSNGRIAPSSFLAQHPVLSRC
jgi:hypothetical protein